MNFNEVKLNEHRMIFGKKHRGKLIERLILTEPYYIDRFMELELHPKYHWIQAHIAKCIKNFNNKPFVVQCCGNDTPCNNQVVLLSFYKFSEVAQAPIPYCKECYLHEASKTGYFVRTYEHALELARDMYRGTKVDLKIILDHLCWTKGLLGRRTDERLIQFFNE
ncbi:MAG TPA: hypothetical protein PKW76_14620 [bacterium]|nr:hypothetical protein [bacterium]